METILLETIEFLKTIEAMSSGLIKLQTEQHRAKLEEYLNNCEPDVSAMADIWE